MTVMTTFNKNWALRANRGVAVFAAPLQLDFEQLDDDNPMKKTAHRHYAMLRKLVDWKDGELVVNPARVGRHFFACRHEANAKSNRTNFLKYMHKIEMLQQERRQLLEAEGVTDERKAVS